MGSLLWPATAPGLFAPPRAWALPSGAPPDLRSGKDQGHPRHGRRDSRRRRGGPQFWSRARLVVPVGVWDVSQRERPHPNKRLKLPAPRAPTGGATQAAQHAIRKSLILPAAAVRAAA